MHVILNIDQTLVKRIKHALEKVKRADFLPPHVRKFATIDIPLGIGYEQTNSQPSVVEFMLNVLSPEEGNIVLDIGAGSGWQTTLLAELVGKTGKVYAFERILELCYFLESNIAKYPELKKRIETFCRSASDGLPNINEKKEFFDRIVVAASVLEVPNAWRKQLKIGGKLLYPSHGDLILEQKLSKEDFRIERFPGYAFVPYIED